MCCGVDPLEKIEELGGSVAFVALADHGAGGDVAVSYTHLTLPTSDLV